MVDLRRYAKNRECDVRLVGICCANPETSVLAHFRQIGVSGMGQRGPDAIACVACVDCHAEIDRRTQKLPADEARLAHAEGVFRFQAHLISRGILKW